MLSDQLKTSFHPSCPPKETWVAFDESCCPWKAILSLPLRRAEPVHRPLYRDLDAVGLAAGSLHQAVGDGEVGRRVPGGPTVYSCSASVLFP